MERSLKTLVCILLATTIGYSSETYAGDPDLSTPDATIATHYRAYKFADFELLKKAYMKEVNWITKQELREVSTVFRDYKILEKRILKKDEFNEEGDVRILVMQQFKDKKGGKKFFFLRKLAQDWLIVHWDAADETEHVDDRIIGEEIRKMFPDK